MRDSVPSGSYSSVCNVLRQWKSRSSLLIESTDSMIYIYRTYSLLVPGGAPRKCATRKRIAGCIRVRGHTHGRHKLSKLVFILYFEF